MRTTITPIERTRGARERQQTETRGANTRTRSVDDLEAEARMIARQGGETKEQAFSRLLECNPEVYASYRAQHNAKPLLATLKAAGLNIGRA